MMTITRLRLRQTSRARLSSCITTEAVTAIQKYAAAYKKFNAAQLKYADVNKDGKFDALDVTVLQRKLVDFDEDPFNEVAADVDLDGTVDVIDVTLMQRVLVNITTWEAWDAKHPA